MRLHAKKQIDVVVRRKKIACQDLNISELAQKNAAIFQNSRGFSSPTKIFFLGKMSLLALLVTAVVPLSAFEAHVVNVTATIERPPCEKFDVHSLGYWKNHDNLWVLPQIVGGDDITDPEHAVAVFAIKPNNARNRVRAQLLALKFNIAAYDGGEAYVPGEEITLETLAQEAQALLLQKPPVSSDLLNDMKDRIEKVNLASEVTLCKEPIAGEAIVSSNSSGAEEEEGETESSGANVSLFALSVSSESSAASATTSAAIDDASATSSSDGAESGATSTPNVFNLSVPAADEDSVKEEINSSSQEGNTAVSTSDTLLVEEEPVAPVEDASPPPPVVVVPLDNADENSPEITLEVEGDDETTP